MIVVVRDNGVGVGELQEVEEMSQRLQEAALGALVSLLAIDKIQAWRRLTGQAALRRRWLRLSAKRAATSLPAF